MESRIVIALALVAACALVAGVSLAIYLPRRRRDKLRRRGIKTYEHRRPVGGRIA